MQKKITVPAKHQYSWDYQTETSRQLMQVLNELLANAYKDGYATGYHDRGIFTRIKRRLTKK